LADHADGCLIPPVCGCLTSFLGEHKDDLLELLGFAFAANCEVLALSNAEAFVDVVFFVRIFVLDVLERLFSAWL